MMIAELLSASLRAPAPPFGAATELKDLPGWDSLVMVRLMLKLEDIAGRELAESELASLQTVGDVERLLKALE